jgi:glycosyltransferase involved in cell wall biosynthesis
MQISLCMIVRDEEETLARCLRSIRGVVDEMCVVDTGSRDRSREIARALGARVEEVPWDDHFAEARNASLDLARGDWILVLDGDEELANPDQARARLEDFARRRRRALGRVLVEYHDPTEGALARVALTRFFPRDPGVRFAGRVCERVVCTEGAPERRDTGLRVLHHGYDAGPSPRHKRAAQRARLLEFALAEEPCDAFLYYQLARTHSAEGREEECWRASRSAIELAPRDAPWLAHLVETGAYALRALGRSEEALRLIDDIHGRFPERPDTSFLRALLLMDLGRLDAAAESFRSCMELEGRQPAGGETAPSASTYAPAYNLGVMFEVLGLLSEARGWYERALAFQPNHGPSLEGLARVREEGG